MSKHFNVQHLSEKKANHTLLWAIGISVLIVISTAMIGRAATNLSAAIQEKPDIAVYLLLKDEGITNAELVRELETERAYLTETDSGPLLVRMKKGEEGWYIAEKERMRE